MTELTTLQKALITIKKLKNSLQEANKVSEPIAIIGMGCRFPYVNNKDEYWDLLKNGKNTISDMPDERWLLLKESIEFQKRDYKHHYWGSYLEKISDFDAYFFGVSPREAIRMDPQQRLLLEVAYEAAEDAGLSVESLKGSNTGVFASLYTSHFAHLQKLDNEMDALYLPTGNAVSIAANRLSYLFDLRGPSMVIDTACSSSLVAVHLACLNLQAQLCDLAFVGSVNINLLPSIHLILSQAKMLSSDGQCKTFDANANGYVQGEGIGVIVLKPLSKALQQKDRIYAVITGTAVNQDGKTNGLTAPNGLQQKDVIQSAYRVAKIDPNQISYVECHGTGTKLGDPVEIQALGEVLGNNRDKANPCWIGSVKTNIGHLEPAAGIASIIKVALALKYREIPAHLNYVSSNPHISLSKYNFQIPVKTLSWPKCNTYRMAGISGFGFGGSNAHIVMRELADEENSIVDLQYENNDELFTLSAKDPEALKNLIKKWCAYLEKTSFSLSQICYNLHVKRSHYPYRLAIVVRTTAELYKFLCKLHENMTYQSDSIFTNINNPISTNYSEFNLEGFDKTDLCQLANLYINQYNIDWTQYEETRKFPMIDMPLYAWQRKTYWPSFDTRNENKQDDYPLQGKRISSPLSALQFEFLFDTKMMPEIQDTFNVLHAGYYLEMIAFAMSNLFQQDSFTAEDIDFLSPLLVLPNEPVKVQLLIHQSEPDETSFRFLSYVKEQNSWIEHAKGKLSTCVIEDKSIDTLEEVKKNFTVADTAETFYNRITKMGMPAGDTIHWTHQFWLSDKQILCQFRESKPSDKNDQFKLHMHLGVIDACIQPIFMMLPDTLMNPYVASHIDKITFFGKHEAPKYVLSILKNIESDGEKLIGNWRLFDSKNKLITQCENLTMSQLSNKMQIDKIIGINLKNQLDLSLPYPELKQKITQYLLDQIALIFSMPKQDLNVQQSLLSLGLDSLMALALMRVIESGLGITYSLQQIMQGPSINEISDYVISVIFPSYVQHSVQENNHNNLWIAYRQPKKTAKIRLFCFPYGGGGASIYREWQNYLPDSIEVCPIQLPGRENRLDEQPIDTIENLIEQLIENLQSEFNIPFAFFGHSFGSLIAFELTRYMRKHKFSLPIHLFLSAYPDPRLPARSLEKLLAQLNLIHLNLFELNHQALEELSEKKLNMLSTIFSENGLTEYSGEKMDKDVIKVLLPIFISDMNVVKSYRYQEEALLDIPLTVFLGDRDTWVSYEDHLGWADHTQKRCDFHIFDSGHLFVRDVKIRSKIIQHVVNIANKHTNLSLTHQHIPS